MYLERRFRDDDGTEIVVSQHVRRKSNPRFRHSASALDIIYRKAGEDEPRREVASQFYRHVKTVCCNRRQAGCRCGIDD